MALYSIERAAQQLPATGTLVMLHGYGANEEDLISLGAAIDPRLACVGIRAPLSLPWGGYAWYPLVPRGAGIDFNPDDVAEAVRQATEAIEAIAKRDGRAPILLGFSQGGGVALSLALLRPDLVRAVIALSAVPPMVPMAQRAPRETLARLPIFAAHGTRDEILPIVYGQTTRATLEESGCNVDWHTYVMGHEICDDELKDLRTFVAKL
jgi:phospholipase/carboxylesterase